MELSVISEDEPFFARNYQMELLEKCKKGNVVIYLPTGSGKTFIAIQLIGSMAEQFKSGKKTFFLVHRKVLVEQQAVQLTRHLPHKIGKYHGDMNVDDWEQEKWQKELDEHDILVMTAQVFLDRLLHGFFSLSQVNLLILDECHHSSKGDPYRRIMDQYAALWERDPASLPKVLGLTAALVKPKVKPHQIPAYLEDIKTNLHASIETCTNLSEVLSYSACPEPEFVFCEYTSTDNQADFKEQLNRLRLKYKGTLDSEFSKATDDTFKLILTVLKTLGMWSAKETSIQFLKKFLQLSSESCFKDTFLEHVVDDLHEISIDHNSLEKLEKSSPFCSPQKMLSLLCCPDTRIHRVLDLLSGNKDNLSALIFVEQRIIAYALRDVLSTAATLCPTQFGHIKVSAIIGYSRSFSPMKKADVEQDESFAKLQDAALKAFESGKINVLVATNVLEEGVDIGICNLVIRFDLPKDYCSYIQSRGRARHRDSKFIILCLNIDHKKMSEVNQMTNHIQSNLNDDELIADNFDSSTDYDGLIQPYKVFTKNECFAVLKLSNAVSLLFRYCSNLPTDLAVLEPNFSVHPFGAGYLATLRLPKNSPLNVSVEGKEMPNKSLAKRAAAFECCKILHQKGELDGYLLPKKKIIQHIAALPHQDLHVVGAGTKARKQMHPRCLMSQFPDLVQHNKVLYLSKISASSSALGTFYSFGILSGSKLPQIPVFSLFQSSAPIISVSAGFDCCIKFCVSKEEESILESYHSHVFQCIMASKTKENPLKFNSSSSAFLIVPLVQNFESDFPELDWKVATSVSRLFDRKNCCPQKQMLVDLKQMKTWENLVFLPWYRNKENPILYKIVEIHPECTAQSPFPDSSFKSFASYFIGTYGIEINDHEQPLLVTKVLKPSILNLLKPEPPSEPKTQAEVNLKKRNHYLLPELIIKHPIQAQEWHASWLLPSICYRLNGILCALKICTSFEIDLGKNSSWSPLMFHDNNNCSASSYYHSVSKEKLSLDSGNNKDSHTLLMDEDGWNKAINVLLNLNNPDNLKNSTQCKRTLEVPKAFPDRVSPYDIGQKGCSSMPAFVLEALTTKSANDLFNLERLETLGDSYLKLAVTEYLFNNYQWHEGDLTALKTSLVCNKTLYGLGYKNGIAQYMQCSQFIPGSNWIPPGFQHVEKYASSIAHNVVSIHEVSDKSIADCVEALIGAFIMTAGAETAYDFIWSLGVFSLIQEEPSPGLLYTDSTSVQELEHTWEQKNFIMLEEIIGYHFDNKNFLVAAFTHPSYTGWAPESYQRLEFLGDAVIDYLIMRYCFARCSDTSPGFLTDVRAALVNNRLFGKLAAKFKLHTFLLSSSFQLHHVIDRFVKEGQDNFHSLQFSNNDPPKILGDLFEALAGAIYLDSAGSLETVWKVFYGLMYDFIEKFIVNPPLNEVRMIHELASQKKLEYEFVEKDSEQLGKVEIELVIEGFPNVLGNGRNKRDAKLDAAKKFFQMYKE